MEKDEYLNSSYIEDRIAELGDLIEDETADSEEKAEHAELLVLRKEASQCSDWNYGETLIRADAFEEYTAQLIDDVCEFPKDVNMSDWPYRHMKMDIKAAADELARDYTEVNFGNVVYLIRS